MRALKDEEGLKSSSFAKECFELDLLDVQLLDFQLENFMSNLVNLFVNNKFYRIKVQEKVQKSFLMKISKSLNNKLAKSFE